MSVDYGPFDRHTLDLSFDWLQNAELRSLTATPAVSRAGQLAWFSSLPEKSGYKIWSLRLEGIPIGAFGLKNITPDAAEYWGYIGSAGNWGKGIGRKMMKFSEDEAVKIGLQKIYLNVVFSNYRAINLYYKVGYKILEMNDGGYRMEKRLDVR